MTTTAFAAAWPIVHDTVVWLLYPTSGRMVAVHEPSACFEIGSVMVNVTVDRALAPLAPPRFRTVAVTRQVAAQRDVSTDSTV